MDKSSKFSVELLLTWHRSLLERVNMMEDKLICGLSEFFCMHFWLVHSPSEARTKRNCMAKYQEGNTNILKPCPEMPNTLYKDWLRLTAGKDLEPPTWWENNGSNVTTYRWAFSKQQELYSEQIQLMVGQASVLITQRTQPSMDLAVTPKQMASIETFRNSTRKPLTILNKWASPTKQ